MMRIAMPFYAITWVRYNELQYQRWEYATPFGGCSWVRYEVLQCHFVGVRGYGHDKSDPTPTEWTWRYVDYNK